MRLRLSLGEIEHWAAVCAALGGLWAVAKTIAKADHAAEEREARLGLPTDQRKIKSATRAKSFYSLVVIISVGLVGWVMWEMSRDIGIAILAAITLCCCELLAFFVMYLIFRWIYRPTTLQSSAPPSGFWARLQASKWAVAAGRLLALGGLPTAIYAFVRAMRLVLE